MSKSDVTRRSALGGLAGVAATPYYGLCQSRQSRSADDVTAVKRIFIDLQLSEAEAATSKGQLFQVIDSAAGASSVYRRSASGSDKLYDVVTASSLRGADGSCKVGFDNDTVDTRLNILSATMRPAMRGIFSSRSDQRPALLDFIAEAARGGKTIEWGPVDLSLDVVTRANGWRGLAVPSGSRWVMHPDTRLRALPNDASHYEIINLADAEDVVIEGNGARILGDRNEHTGFTGEWGMGVSIRGATNIRIRDLIVEDCWGDGFYVGSSETQFYSRDVLLEKIKGTNNRRQGLSLISARGFRCVDSTFELTNGTNPQYGVDIEPNNPDEYLEDVVFDRCHTKGNTGNGFGIFLNAMSGTTHPVDIRIIDHSDDGSSSCIYGGTDSNIPGLVQVIRPKSINAISSAITFRNKRISGPKWEIVEPTCVDWNRAGSGSSSLSSAILIYAPSGDSGTEAIGNIDIVRPNIRPLSSGSAANAVAVFEQRTTTPDDPDQIRILNPVNLAGLPCVVSGVTTFTDENRTSVRVLPDASLTVSLSTFGRHIEIPALSSTRNFDISNTQSIGMEFTFELTGAGAGEARIRFPPGVSLVPDTLGAGRHIFAASEGARLRIRKIAASKWQVVEKVGTWTTA